MKSLKKLAHSKNKRIMMVLFAIGALLLSGIFYKVVYQKQTYIIVKIKGSPGNWWWVTPRPPDWLVFSIKKGDKEYNATNRPTAEVLSVDVYDSGGSTRDIYILAKLEVRHNPQTNQYRYKGEPVEIGGPISLSLNGKFFPGMVTANYGEKMPQRTYVEKTIRIRHKNRLPYEYDSIVVGDTIVDGDGVVISEIIDKSRAPAIDTESYINGRLVYTQSMKREDFYITVKMRMVERNGEYIYREEQYVKAGNDVWIMFPRYNITEAQVISIE